ncbi:MAG: serine--tRNA ligase [Chloroflexi bacterium]|nr:MAG: serine--tRNA ligase [Chloroflexota bacterium]
MLDIRIIREQPDFVKAEIAKLHTEAPIDEILRLDERRRAITTEVEGLRALLNAGSRETGKKAPGAERDAHIAEMRALGERIAALDAELTQVESNLYEQMLLVPNLPAPDVPVGKDESENVISETFGSLRVFDFAPRPHWEFGPELGIIDFDRGVKVSGSRFYFLKGHGARLQRAVITWLLDLHVEKQGYSEVYPPVLVRSEALVGTGNLPKFGDALFRDADAGMWLIPTAEVPVTNMYRDEILDAAQLPINHAAYSACFRNESASAGRDVRGIKRGFQFDKVEMVKFVTPETSAAEHERLIADAAEALELLEIPYRKVTMCTGDLSFVAAKKVDLEAWAPGCGEWLEVSSCSNFHDFQARRANIRYRPAEGERPRFVHTLNGSGLGMPRTMIAILENYQRADGSVDIPAVLRPYMRGIDRITGA